MQASMGCPGETSDTKSHCHSDSVTHLLAGYFPAKPEIPVSIFCLDGSQGEKVSRATLIYIRRYTTLLSFLLITGCGSQTPNNAYDMHHSQDESIENSAKKLATLLPDDSDSDQDLIPDLAEYTRGTDPNNPDENHNNIPDGMEGDPFFSLQWYLHNDRNQSICTTSNTQTIAGKDLHLLPLYHYTLGATHYPMVIQVVDGGVEQHEDLSISTAHSINSVDGTRDPTPTEGLSEDPVQLFYRGHGTAVAGIIAATAFNDTGIRGVAPQAMIAGSNWLEEGSIEALTEVWVKDTLAEEIAISNNSWGKKFLDDKSYEHLMEEASRHGRDGKGRLFVFAAGNDREEYGNANLSYLINNPYAIAVAALNHQDTFSSYSSPGSNILVSAYGGEHYYTAPTIMSTFSPGLAMSKTELAGRKGPITVAEDISRDYTYAMNGTSAAAPMVSGALALVLDLCPELGWRDVRWLIAKHATPIDRNNSTWIQNASGLWHSNDYGFGKINPIGMAADCLDPAYHNLPPSKTLTVSRGDLHLAIPDTNQSIQQTLVVAEDIMIEWVALTAVIDHPYTGDLEISLVSPAGTVSQLIAPNFIKANAFKEGFRFATVSLLGESAKGSWQVIITDRLKDDNGTLYRLSLDIRGHKRP